MIYYKNQTSDVQDMTIHNIRISTQKVYVNNIT